MEGLRPWAILSLLGFLSFLGATYDWFDADEFVNLQQAIRVDAGHRLYLDTPSNHPPLYTQFFLAPLMLLPGPDLLAARVASTILVWLTGLMVADLFRREVGLGAARTFITFWTLNGFVLVAGTRAMNEVPLTALLVGAAYALMAGRGLVMAAAAASAGLLVRYTAIFFLPALLPRSPRRAIQALALGALFLAALIGLLLPLRPDAFQALVDWTLRFHAVRTEEERVRRIGKALWWSGILFAFPVAWRAGLLRRPLEPMVLTGMMAFTGALLIVALPAVHVHYFLPTTVLVTACAVMGVGRLRTGRQQYLVFTGFLLVTASQGGFYVPQTPHEGLEDAAMAAAWIASHTPQDAAVLTDAPQYAILAHRENWRGYYWSLRNSFSDDEFRQALDEVSLVAVSERFGRYDQGFPAGFLGSLEPLPCEQLNGLRLYWTGSSGDPTSGFDDPC